MIGTIEIKSEQLKYGAFSIGCGKEVVLIIGSCRAVPYLTYLNDLGLYTIYFIDPFNWNWNINDERTDYIETLKQCESNQHILNILKSTDIFIHEYYENAGMFNIKNIYSFGLKPKIDICLPNFNDVFILTKDIIDFNLSIKKDAIADYNTMGRLSSRTLADIETVRNSNLEKFYYICGKSDFPGFAEIFSTQYKCTRFFWTFNHISKYFTKTIFNLMNEKFLKLGFVKLSEVDLYENNYTHLCEYDVGYNYNEAIKPLKEWL